jgi:hypothetical protein
MGAWGGCGDEKKGITRRRAKKFRAPTLIHVDVGRHGGRFGQVEERKPQVLSSQRRTVGGNWEQEQEAKRINGRG